MQKKNKKKGFTLIELLAVLVVLAILALIAIPIVIKVINNAREDSYKRSIEGYARAAELAVAQWGLQHPGEAFPTKLEGEKIEQTYTIDYKGDKVACQKMDVEEETGLITLRYCQVMKNKTEAKSKKYYKYEDSTVTEDTEPPTVTYEEYSIGATFTFDGSGYHVISTSDASQEYVVALKDEPLTTDEVTALGYTPSYTYTGGTKQWAGMYYDNTSPYSTDYDTSDVKPLVDAWANQYASKLSEVNGYKARLIKFEELTTNLGYVNSIDTSKTTPSSNGETPSWVYNSEYWYWTMSQYSDSASDVWDVGINGFLNYSYVVNDIGGVRPVINVYKSEISKN